MLDFNVRRWSALIFDLFVNDVFVIGHVHV